MNVVDEAFTLKAEMFIAAMERIRTRTMYNAQDIFKVWAVVYHGKARKTESYQAFEYSTDHSLHRHPAGAQLELDGLAREEYGIELVPNEERFNVHAEDGQILGWYDIEEREVYS